VNCNCKNCDTIQLDEGEGTTPTQFWMTCMKNKENFQMNGLDKSDVHTCMAKWFISWDRTFRLKVNHTIVVKLNTGCVRNVVSTLSCGLGWPCLGTDTGFLFPGTYHTYPHLDENHNHCYAGPQHAASTVSMKLLHFFSKEEADVFQEHLHH
jgi:hypothetical protein